MKRKLIFENAKSKISLVDSATYCSILEKDMPEQIVMKVLNSDLPRPDEIEQFYNEYKILKDISHTNIRKVYLKTKYHNRHTIFLEWVDGKPLVKLGKVKLNTFFALATQIASALVEVHARGIIHNDVNANNIIMSSTSHGIKLIDFEIASQTETTNLSFEGTANYASPEQSEHSKEVVVDHRSDLYSVGVVFYLMLTGMLPFQSSTIEGLKRMHLRQRATPIKEIDPAIPPPLSALVEKLMAKNPKDRYQSARGLLYDLEAMLSFIGTGDEGRTIDPNFIIGSKDFSGRLQASHELYGREDEIVALSSAFDQVLENGTSKVCLVAGAAGTGKTSLVNELRERTVDKKGGYFISGKFDRLRKDEPYSAILRAFDSFCGLILEKESGENVEIIRNAIRDALGAEGKILTFSMPKLQCIIGNQPDVPDVDPMQIKNRLNNVFLKFVNAITFEKRPILFFIDDLQWADPESLSLLSVLTTDKDVKYALFVGAYRHDEIDNKSVYLIQLLDQMKNDQAVQKIKIGDLSKDDTTKLIHNLLNPAHDQTSALADLVYHKTHGNAFFIIQFLKSLANGGMLYFCHVEYMWKWDMEKIMKMNATKNVVEFLVQSMIHLSDEMKHVLKMASCIGSQFRLSTLRLIVEGEHLWRNVNKAVAEGIIVVVSVKDETFRFSHDRIQQAVYSLILESDRNSMHLQIGRVLKENLKGNEVDEMLFVMVNQLNSGLEMIEDQCERTDMAHLNLRAAKKARFSSAFKQASGYLESGISLLTQDRWIEQYNLSLELYSAAIEIDYCNGDYDHMNVLVEELLLNTAGSILDQVRSYSVKINYLRAQQRFDDSLKVGLHVLSELGEPISPTPSIVSVIYNLYKTKMMLWRDGSSDAIISMQSVVDKKILSKMKLLCTTLLSAIVDNLRITIVLRMVQLSLSHGVSEYSAIAFVSYGMSLVRISGDIDEGYRFGQIALQLFNRFSSKAYIGQVYAQVFGGLHHMKKHIHNGIPHLLQSAQVAQEVGQIEMSFICVYLSCNYSFISGISLVEVEEKTKACHENARTYQQEHIITAVKPIRQAIRILMDNDSMKDKNILDEMLKGEEIQENSHTNYILVTYYSIAIMLAYMFYEYDQAVKISEDGRDKFPSYWFNKTAITFYEGLTALIKARQDENNKKWIKLAKDSIKDIRKLAESGPDNHLHKFHLLLAEFAIYEGCEEKAIEHFDKAIDIAERKKFMNIEALASERALILCIEQSNISSAPTYYSRACQVYKEWGASAKVRQLEELYGKHVSSFCTTTLKRKGGR